MFYGENVNVMLEYDILLIYFGDHNNYPSLPKQNWTNLHFIDKNKKQTDIH